MARAVEAVEVEVQWEDGVERLWMSERDIRANISEFGTSQGLTDALACYRTRSLVKTLPNRVIP